MRLATRLQVRAGAERALGPGEDGREHGVVALGVAEGVIERRCGFGVDGVARLRPVDGDDGDGAVPFGDDAHAHPWISVSGPAGI